MEKVLIIRYGELHLKGKNRSFFENLLVNNIKKAIKNIECTFTKDRGRYFISDFSQDVEQILIGKVTKVFGIHSVSLAIKIESKYDLISKTAIELCDNNGKFRVNTNRADKTFALGSLELSRKVGQDILESNSNLEVDLHNPTFIINIDIRENGSTYLYSNKILAVGGLPVGSSGKGMLLLSGGIDSPVAGYMISKRGLYLDAIHFHSYPYTSEMAKNKVIELAEKLTEYSSSINLCIISITEIQEAIHKYCNSNYMITILRRCMMEIAEKVALKRKCLCLVNGESLGQVASQTIESITVTNQKVRTIPVLRPLIGMDKSEIVAIAQQIDTYSTSIQPYEDCCTVFLPENPLIKPNLEKVVLEEEKIVDLDTLIEEAISKLEVIHI